MCDCKLIKTDALRIGDVYHHETGHDTQFIALTLLARWDVFSPGPVVLCHRLTNGWDNLQYTSYGYEVYLVQS